MFELKEKSKELLVAASFTAVPFPFSASANFLPSLFIYLFFFYGVRSLEDMASLNYPANAFGATLFSVAAQRCQR